MSNKGFKSWLASNAPPPVWIGLINLFLNSISRLKTATNFSKAPRSLNIVAVLPPDTNCCSAVGNRKPPELCSGKKNVSNKWMTCFQFCFPCVAIELFQVNIASSWTVCFAVRRCLLGRNNYAQTSQTRQTRQRPDRGAFWFCTGQEVIAWLQSNI